MNTDISKRLTNAQYIFALKLYNSDLRKTTLKEIAAATGMAKVTVQIKMKQLIAKDIIEVEDIPHSIGTHFRFLVDVNKLS